MNATIANFQAPLAPAMNAAGPSEAAPAGSNAAESSKAGAASWDFAGTLHGVAGKTSRKADSA
jgi:hypothetical protein